MRKIIMFVGFCVLCMFVTPAFASSCPAGMAPIQALADYLNRNGVTEYFTVQEPQRSALVDRINRAVPPTNWEPDSVVVYTKGPTGMLVFYVGDCAWSPGPAPLSRLEPLRPTQS